MRTHDAASDGLEPRSALAAPLWLGWAVFAALLTVGPLLWHLDYFAQTGPYFRPAILAVLAGLALSAWVYHRFLAKAIRGRELRLFFGFALTATLLQEPLATVVILVVAASAYAVGGAGLDRLGVETASTLERLALATAAGLGAWAVMLIPIGLLGLYRPWVFALLIALSLILFGRRLAEALHDLRALDEAWREIAAQSSPLLAVVVAFLPAFATAFWLAAMAPATATDPIAYHMPSVRHYLLTGKLAPLEMLPGAYKVGRGLFRLGHSAAYSYYPQSFEELQTLTWALGGQAAAQLVSPLFFLLTALLAAAIGRRCGVSRLAAVVGVAAAVTIPVISWSGAIAKNDSMLACFELGALLAVIAARERPGRPWLFLAAFFVGAGFGTKHVALYGAIPVSVLMLNRLKGEPARLKLASALAAVCLLTGFSWHFRTFLATGSPVFPAGVRHATRPMPAVGGTTATPWLDRVTYPWIAHFHGGLTNEGPSENPLGFYFLFFGATWLIWRRRERSPAERDCLLFCGLYAVYWIYTWGILRYGIPILFVLAALTAHRVVALGAASNRWVRRVAAGALAYCFSFALLPALMFEVNEYQLRYFARKYDREGYVRAMLKEIPSIDYLNAHMPDGQWALAINNCASVYARDPARFRCLEMRVHVDEETVRHMVEVIGAASPEFLVVPRGWVGEQLEVASRGFPDRKTVFEDKNYRVLER